MGTLQFKRKRVTEGQQDKKIRLFLQIITWSPAQTHSLLENGKQMTGIIVHILRSSGWKRHLDFYHSVFIAQGQDHLSASRLSKNTCPLSPKKGNHLNKENCI